MDDALREWLDAFIRAYEHKSPDMLVELFSINTVYHLSPFEAPLSGLEAVNLHFTDTFSVQRAGHFNGRIIGIHDQAGWVHWASSFTREGTDEPVRQEGIMNVVLDEAGKCTEIRQWWHVLEPVQADMMRDFDA